MAMQTLKDTFMPYGRFKEINGNYAQSKTDYAERVKEKQAALRTEKAKEAAEVCVCNTDKVDREIEKLKEKKRELEQQIQSAFGDETPSGYHSMPSGDKVERKIQELEKKLAQVEQELSQKDNDTYRKQHSEFFRMT